MRGGTCPTGGTSPIGTVSLMRKELPLLGRLDARLRSAWLGQERTVSSVEEAAHPALREGFVEALALGAADRRLHDGAERAAEQVSVEEARGEQALQCDRAVQPHRGLGHHRYPMG